MWARYELEIKGGLEHHSELQKPHEYICDLYFMKERQNYPSECKPQNSWFHF